MKKVLFHAHELDDWSKVIASATNAMKDFVNVDVVLLGNGSAVQIVNQPEIVKMAESLLEKGATFELCGHALTAQGLTKEQVNKINFTYVPSGVVELIDRQEDGYAYIRA
ncbi:DsrE family protein [Aerococcaceae bacterium DSM 111021]|nr:DsrE family protein [Aerococcaceae bacterium DSM 111021]